MSKYLLSQDEKTNLFMNLFTGLKYVYGTYNIETGKSYQVKAVVDKNVIIKHLWGYQPYGVYLLIKDKIKAIAVDFDANDLIPIVRFTIETNRHGIPVYIERSKSKGYHVWIFFEYPIQAFKARMLVHHILNEIGCKSTEVFPKRNELGGNTEYGNFINAPLFNDSVKKQRTVFVDPRNNYLPFKDQWKVLYNIKKYSGQMLDNLINKLELNVTKYNYSKYLKNNSDTNKYALLPCKQKMLANGVMQYQRLACFRLAICLRKTGMSFDDTIYTLKEWALKNKPIGNKRIITEKEIIAQTESAFRRKYRSVGCECPSVMPFCEPDCPVKKKR